MFPSRVFRVGAAAAAAMALGLSGAAAVTKPIGKVWLIKEKAFEKYEMNETWDDLFIDDNIILNQWVRTPEDAALHVRFADDTQLRLGANAEIVIDKYVHDPSGRSAGEATFSLVSGMTRIITGGIHQVEVRTPTSTIGIRGSDFIVAQVLGVGTVVQVNEGLLQLTACSILGTQMSFNARCAGAPSVMVRAGESAGVSPDGSQIAMGVSLPYEDSGLRDDGGLLDLAPGSGRRSANLPGPFRFNDPELSNLNVLETVQSSSTVSPTIPLLAD